GSIDCRAGTSRRRAPARRPAVRARCALASSLPPYDHELDAAGLLAAAARAVRCDRLRLAEALGRQPPAIRAPRLEPGVRGVRARRVGPLVQAGWADVVGVALDEDVLDLRVRVQALRDLIEQRIARLRDARGAGVELHLAEDDELAVLDPHVRLRGA